MNQPDQFTFKELVQNIQHFVWQLLERWKIFVLVSVVGVAITCVYNYLPKQEYSASTSFVLQNSESGLNDISSLASLAGVNLGGLTESSDLFQIDNIQELYRSHMMIATTLLQTATFPEGEDLLVNRYAEQRAYFKKWQKDDDLADFRFDPTLFSKDRRQDSLLLEFTEDIRKENLVVSKPSRKLSILNITVQDEDADFAKAFNEKLVENVNSFYKKTVTKKTGDNLVILQDQADSVKMVLDNAMLALAQLQEAAPNRNPLYKQSLVEEQKLMIDIAASSAMYETVVTNLELAKVSHRNKTPLIQIIDRPILPLKGSRWELAKTVIIGAGMGFVLCFLALTMFLFYQSAMKE
jgi:hypothetical protein